MARQAYSSENSFVFFGPEGHPVKKALRKKFPNALSYRSVGVKVFHATDGSRFDVKTIKDGDILVVKKGDQIPVVPMCDLEPQGSSANYTFHLVANWMGKRLPTASETGGWKFGPVQSGEDWARPGQFFEQCDLRYLAWLAACGPIGFRMDEFLFSAEREVSAGRLDHARGFVPLFKKNKDGSVMTEPNSLHDNLWAYINAHPAVGRVVREWQNLFGLQADYGQYAKFDSFAPGLDTSPDEERQTLPPHLRSGNGGGKRRPLHWMDGSDFAPKRRKVSRRKEASEDDARSPWLTVGMVQCPGDLRRKANAEESGIIPRSDKGGSIQFSGSSLREGLEADWSPGPLQLNEFINACKRRGYVTGVLTTSVELQMIQKPILGKNGLPIKAQGRVLTEDVVLTRKFVSPELAWINERVLVPAEDFLQYAMEIRSEDVTEFDYTRALNGPSPSPEEGQGESMVLLDPIVLTDQYFNYTVKLTAPWPDEILAVQKQGKMFLLDTVVQADWIIEEDVEVGVHSRTLQVAKKDGEVIGAFPIIGDYKRDNDGSWIDHESWDAYLRLLSDARSLAGAVREVSGLLPIVGRFSESGKEWTELERAEIARSQLESIKASGARLKLGYYLPKEGGGIDFKSYVDRPEFCKLLMDVVSSAEDTIEYRWPVGKEAPVFKSPPPETVQVEWTVFSTWKESREKKVRQVRFDGVIPANDPEAYEGPGRRLSGARKASVTTTKVTPSNKLRERFSLAKK